MFIPRVRTIAVSAAATLLMLTTACTSPTSPLATPRRSIRDGVVWGGPNNQPNPNNTVWGGPPWGAPTDQPNNEWQ